MSDDNKTPEEQPADVTPETEAAAGPGDAAEAAADPVETLQAENADLKDRALRTMAEMENLRRRTEKEIKDARQYAVSGFARDMLTVSDNLRRALEAGGDRGRRQAARGPG